MDKPDLSESILLATHRNQARNVTARFRLRHPRFHFRLYESPGEHRFWVHAQDVGDQFTELAEQFEDEFRPVTVPLELVPEVGEQLVPVDEAQAPASEAWLHGHPLSTWEVNHLLQLTDIGMPVGSFDIAEHRNAWLFKTAEELTPDQRDCVAAGVAKLGFTGPIEFASMPIKTPASGADFRLKDQQVAPLVMSSSAPSEPIRRLMERDEDHWRQSLDDRLQAMATPPAEATVSSCLFDAGIESSIGLSELLTLYDRIDVIPGRNDPHWLSRLKIDREDFVRLVAMKRCRLVVPFSADLCRPDVLEAVAELDLDGVVLSRQLAVRARAAAMCKDPLLYGPFSNSERIAVLQALGQSATLPFYTAMLSSYAEIFERQQWQMAMHGAMSFAFSGIGWLVGDAHFRQHGRDGRLEMGVAGAGIEWAMALGSTWIPRHFSGGYDETHNCHMLASFMGRAPFVAQDPVAPRMHLLSDGLLALSEVPPMEVARNFDTDAVRDFRTLSRRLLREAITIEEMEAAVQRINRETERFESRLERLAKWKIHSLLTAAVAKPVLDVVDTQLSPFASLTIAWLSDVIYSKLPSETQAQAVQTLKSILGLALAPSADAVVVSRSRSSLRS
jgi:hypothetical protein